MKQNVSAALVAAVILLATAACSDGTGDGGEPGSGVDKEVFVAHFVSDCMGVGPQKCLNVRESVEDDWTLRYDPIQGFEHEAGYDYRLIINETTISDPPADASSIRWTIAPHCESSSPKSRSHPNFV